MNRGFVVLGASRYFQAGLVVCASFFAASCDSRPEWTYPLQVGLGDTCGDWYRAPLYSHERVHECRSDLICQYFVDVNDAKGGTYGRCRPADEPDDCLDGWRRDPGLGARCFLECTTTADCPQPFQICAEGVCAIVDCANESDVPARDWSACESRLSPDDSATILCDQHLCVLQEGTR